MNTVPDNFSSIICKRVLPRRMHRRLFLWGVLIPLLAILALFTASALNDERWFSPDKARLSGVQARMKRLVSGEAPRLIPDLLAKGQRQVAAVSAEWEKQDDTFFLLRDYRQLKNLLAAVLPTMNQMESALAAARKKDEAMTIRNIALLAEGIDQVKKMFAAGVAEIDIRNRLATAEIKLQEARRHQQENGSATAGRKAAEGLAALESAADGTRKVLSRFSLDSNIVWWKTLAARAIQASDHHRFSLLVVKSLRRLDVYRNRTRLRSFPVELGGRPIQQKTREGDRATPEGQYRVKDKRGRGRTIYSLAFNLDYPNAEDRERFRKLKEIGEIPTDAKIGGLIEIHGKGGRGFDWTLGCIALKDQDMKWLYDRIPEGCPVFIVGSEGEESGEKP